MIIFTLTFKQRSLLNVFTAGSHVYGLYQKYIYFIYRLYHNALVQRLRH